MTVDMQQFQVVRRVRTALAAPNPMVDLTVVGFGQEGATLRSGGPTWAVTARTVWAWPIRAGEGLSQPGHLTCTRSVALELGDRLAETGARIP